VCVFLSHFLETHGYCCKGRVSPKVVSDSNSRQGRLAELIELFTQGTQATFAVGIGILTLTEEFNYLVNSHLTLLEQSTAH